MDDFEIQWSESLRVGQPAIDEHHREHILVDDKKIGLFLKRQGG